MLRRPRASGAEDVIDDQPADPVQRQDAARVATGA